MLGKHIKTFFDISYDVFNTFNTFNGSIHVNSFQYFPIPFSIFQSFNSDSPLGLSGLVMNKCVQEIESEINFIARMTMTMKMKWSKILAIVPTMHHQLKDWSTKYR